MNIPRSLHALLAAACLSGCDKGTVNLFVADAPVDDADRIVVQFTGVVLEHSNGKQEEFDFDPRSIDLAAQTEGQSAALLDGVLVEDGAYTALRLKVQAGQDGTDSFIEIGGTSHPLHLPPANESGLRIASRFAVERQEEISLTIDFDLRKSVLNPETADQFELRPTLRLIETARAGAIAGSVSATLAGASGCRPAVYVYAGQGVAPDDEGSATPPFASARVRPSGAAFFYQVSWLPAGGYTAAFTCEAGADDPELDDSVAFSNTTDVTVAEGQGTTIDFP